MFPSSIQLFKHAANTVNICPFPQGTPPPPSTMIKKEIAKTQFSKMKTLRDIFRKSAKTLERKRRVPSSIFIIVLGGGGIP